MAVGTGRVTPAIGFTTARRQLEDVLRAMPTMWKLMAAKPKRGEDVEEYITVTIEQDQNTVLNDPHMPWTSKRHGGRSEDACGQN